MPPETLGEPSSPTLEVTQGYIRFHCLQANSNAGPGGARDPNGGNLVILEIWSVGGGGEPRFRRGDSNADGTLNITDGIYVLNFLFLGGPDPLDPGPNDCGEDPTEAGDPLDCGSFPPCP